MGATGSKVQPRIPHEVLLSLLYKPEYRDKWVRYVQRRRGNSINQRAVAALIAYELSELQNTTIDPHTIKDRVSRALKGETISEATAQMFIDAFDFAPEHAKELIRSVQDHERFRKVLDAPKDPTARQDNRDTDCRSLSTMMECSVDAFGFIRHFEVTEAILILKDGLQEFDLRFEANPANCHLLEGGTLKTYQSVQAPTVSPEEEEAHLYELLVEFDRPLQAGEVHQIRYRVSLDILTLLEDPLDSTTVVVGPFFPGRHNVTLAARFDVPPPSVQQKIWADGSEGPSILLKERLPQQHYYSISYPIAEDVLFSLSWDKDREGALRHYAPQGP